MRMANEDHRKQTRVTFLLPVNDGGRDIATQCVRGILRNSTRAVVISGRKEETMTTSNYS